MEMTFNEAYENLSQLVSQLEHDDIQLDTLAEKVRQSRTLIEYCEAKLRTIEGEVGKELSK